MTGQQKHIANAQQSYTLASRTSHRTEQSLPKSMPAPTQEKYEVFTNTFDNKNDVSKIQNIFSSPSKKIKTPDTQADTKKTLKLNKDKGCETQTTRTPACNTGLAKVAVTCFYDSFVVKLTVVHLMYICRENRQLRQHANR